MFMGLLFSIILHYFASNHTECVLLSNQKCMTQPTMTQLLLIHILINTVNNFTTIYLELN